MLTKEEALQLIIEDFGYLEWMYKYQLVTKAAKRNLAMVKGVEKHIEHMHEAIKMVQDAFFESDSEKRPSEMPSETS